MSARTTVSRQTIRRRNVIVEKRPIPPADNKTGENSCAVARLPLQPPPAVGRIAAEVARFRMRGKDRFPLEWLAGTI